MIKLTKTALLNTGNTTIYQVCISLSLKRLLITHYFYKISQAQASREGGFEFSSKYTSAHIEPDYM